MKKLALLILWVFICSGSIYALSDQNVEEISKTSEVLADAFVKKINEGSLWFSQWKAIIEGGIDYYLAKVKGMSEKDVPNLYTFEQINWRLIDNQLNNSNKRLEHNWRNYMKRLQQRILFEINSLKNYLYLVRKKIFILSGQKLTERRVYEVSCLPIERGKMKQL